MGMRRTTGLLGFGAIALLLLLPAQERARPLSLHGPQRQEKGTVLAFLQRWDGTRLVRVDDRSLAQVGRASSPLGLVDTWAFSRAAPALLAVAGRTYENDETSVLRFVNAESRRVVKRTVRLDGLARALLWARPDRVVAIVGRCCTQASYVVVVDPGARRVVATREIPGEVSVVARGARSLVVLATPRGKIGASTLDVIDDEGSVRSVALDRVVAGTVWATGEETDPISTTRVPGLAVDSGGTHAFVVQPDGPAVEIDLRTLAVAHHDLVGPKSLLGRLSAWLTPAAQAKGGNGPRRSATWLGDGLIAVTGTDEHAERDSNGGIRMSMEPAGLAILDTRDWTVSALDPGADSVTTADGFLLATGSRWSSEQQEPTGMGVAAYGADRALRFRLFGGRSVWVEAALGGRAYVSVNSADGARAVNVVDLETGQVVAERTSDVPMPILGDAAVG